MTHTKFIKELIKLASFTCLALSMAMAIAAEQSSEKMDSKAIYETRYLELGFNLVDLNGTRPAKFYQGQNVPQGFVLPAFRWNMASSDMKNYFRVDAAKLFRTDEQLRARFGLQNLIKGRFNWMRVPWIYGDGARTLLSGSGSDLQRQSAALQRTAEDPDKDGVLGSASDNSLLPNLVRDLFSVATPFSLNAKRRTADVALTFTPTANWSIDLSYRDERREGTRTMGTGTYDRLTFIPLSGSGQDEIFYVRGTELVRPAKFTTRIFHIGTSFSRKSWFVQAGLEWSKFDNDFRSLTYGNPLWYTDTYSKSPPPGIDRGWSRGLWNQGRLALEPSNDALSFDLSGGITLGRSTRLRLSFVRGTVNQNEPFLPYTSNSALNGKVDLNQDGVVDGRDLGTDVSTLPRLSLNGEAVSSSFTLSFSTRPIQPVQINVRIPYFKYENRHGRLSFPYRTEYVESNWNPGIQDISPVFSELTDYSSRGFFIEGVIRPTRVLTVRLFGEMRRREYEEREVKSTDAKTFGIGFSVTPATWIDARLTYSRTGRKFEGPYLPKYRGEQQALRMFDIAKVERDALIAHVSMEAGEKVSLGGNIRYYNDKYRESTFGLQKTKTFGFGLDSSFRLLEHTSFFAYADVEHYEFRGHGDTKMGTFNRPGNDWFYKIADRTISFGGGFDIEIIPRAYTLDLDGYWVDGNVASSNRNATELLYSPLAAGAVNFPDQKSRLAGLRLRIVRRISDQYSVGISYWYERFKLSDFAWDNMSPYGYDFLMVDNALRYLFLDARYGSYAANIGQIFLRITF